MGVPAFFRWLSRKYPSVVSHCVEVTTVDDYGKQVPVNASDPNPNGVEFDNLYLDMNGIIHPCTHPEDRPAPKNEDEMMLAIFECIDRILDIVRPRKILYMAVDGVAPRAKMNQQRSRRFRASKETTEKAREIEKIRERLLSEGAHLPPIKENEAHFDSNCITPGTPFMARLSKCLHYYAHSRLNNHPTWKNIKVILSDANVPGEGEHKIMDFIRKQRGQPDHDPNTKHCLCGADADLIMLGLATHEPYFTIIREEFKPNAERPCDICGKLGHEMKECTGLDSSEEIPAKIVSETQYIFVRLNVLREYLARDLKMPELPFEYNFERVIDDWVFMCFFVGNDFLPHLPSLEIREGAIDRLIGLYKNCVYKTGGYLTEHGSVNLNRVQLIMSDLGVMEDEIFKKRHQTELNFKARDRMKKRQMKRFKQNSQPTRILTGQYAPLPVGRNVPISPIVNPRKEAYSQRVQNMHTNTSSNNDNDKKRKFSEVGNNNSESEEEEVHDEVRLYEAGFKDRYYESKFDVSSDNLEFRYKVGFEYVRGLCWVLHYYYQGCPSWKWFFPYHYAPFASDFVNIAESPIIFEKFTKPFNPLEQLMGVFPAASKSHVPEPWSKLMYDPDSSIIDFYPEDFKVDLNGKKFAWQGVALLPFAEEDRLFKALEPYYDQLTEDEKERNKLGDDRIYIPESNDSYKFIFNLYENLSDYEIETTTVIDKVAGMILLAKDCVSHGGSLEPPINGLPPLVNSKVLCVRYRHLNYPENHIYKSEKLPGAIDPPKLLKPEDLTREQSNSYRPIVGMARSTQRARIDMSGHRMLDFHSTSGGINAYQTVPPPVRYNQHSRGYSHNAPPSYSNKSYAHGGSDFGYNRNNSSQRSNTARGGGGGSHQYNYRDNNPYRQQRDDSTPGYQQQQRDNRNRSEDVPRRSIFSSTWANPSTPESDSRSNNRYQGNTSESYQKFDSYSRMGGPRPSHYSLQQNYSSNRQSNSRYGR